MKSLIIVKFLIEVFMSGESETTKDFDTLLNEAGIEAINEVRKFIKASGTSAKGRENVNAALKLIAIIKSAPQPDNV